MRILHVYRTYFPDPPGGLQEAIRQICLATKLQGVENRIFTLAPNCSRPRIECPEGVVIRARSWAAPASCDIGGVISLRRFLEATAWADIVHYHFPWPFADILDLLTRPDCPKVLTYHSDVIRQHFLKILYRPLMHRMLSCMTTIVATSSAYAMTSPVLSSLAIHKKVRVIPLGIVEDSYPTVGDETIFSRLGLPEGEPYFLFVGVLRYYKGLQTLIEAARYVSAHIVIVGSGPEGEKLRSMAQHKAANNVLFAGQVSNEEKVALIKRCHALVLPSHLRSEAFGMVLVEASIFGRPLISCEIGTGTSFVNAHQESGFVVPPEDPVALAEAMNMLLRNVVLAETFGKGARLRYERLFSALPLGQAYLDLYRHVAQ